jgi:hypothetical protein
MMMLDRVGSEELEPVSVRCRKACEPLHVRDDRHLQDVGEEACRRITVQVADPTQMIPLTSMRSPAYEEGS